MKLGIFLPAVPDLKWTLSRQAGINYADYKGRSGTHRECRLSMSLNR